MWQPAFPETTFARMFSPETEFKSQSYSFSPTFVWIEPYQASAILLFFMYKIGYLIWFNQMSPEHHGCTWELGITCNCPNSEPPILPSLSLPHFYHKFVFAAWTGVQLFRPTEPQSLGHLYKELPRTSQQEFKTYTYKFFESVSFIRWSLNTLLLSRTGLSDLLSKNRIN